MWIPVKTQSSLPFGGQKLKWLLSVLKKTSIRYRITTTGNLEVEEGDEEATRKIVIPVASLENQDPMFRSQMSAWWTKGDRGLGNTAGALGILAHMVLKLIMDKAQCDPGGVDCPYALGKIPECPVSMWDKCRPLNRVQIFMLGISEVLNAQDTEVAELTKRFFLIANKKKVACQTIIQVLAMWMTEGRTGRLMELTKLGPEGVIEGVVSDPAKMGELLLPRVIVIPKGSELN